MRIGERLSRFVGSWGGENGLRMMPVDTYNTSPSIAEVELPAKGNVATIAYTWSDFDGVPQEGLLVVQDGPEPDQVEAVWVDTWGQHPRWMTMIGAASGDRVSLYGTYGEGEGQGGWHVHLHLDDPETLTMTMDNTYPLDGEPGEVVRAVWTRA